MLEKLVAFGNKRFPVLDGDDLVGVVSRADLLAALRRASEEKRPEKLRP